MVLRVCNLCTVPVLIIRIFGLSAVRRGFLHKPAHAIIGIAGAAALLIGGQHQITVPVILRLLRTAVRIQHGNDPVKAVISKCRSPCCRLDGNQPALSVISVGSDHTVLVRSRKEIPCLVICIADTVAQGIRPAGHTSPLIISKGSLMEQGIRHCRHLTHVVVGIADRAACRILHLGQPVVPVKIEMGHTAVLILPGHSVAESVIAIFCLITQRIRFREQVPSGIVGKAVLLPQEIRGKHHLPHGIISKSLAVSHPVRHAGASSVAVVGKDLAAVGIHDLKQLSCSRIFIGCGPTCRSGTGNKPPYGIMDIQVTVPLRIQGLA